MVQDEAPLRSWIPEVFCTGSSKETFMAIYNGIVGMRVADGNGTHDDDERTPVGPTR